MNKASQSIFLCFLLFSALITSSCRKFIEDKKRDMLIEVMTNGDWYVEEYVEGALPLTDDFTGYYFKFEENGSVSGSNDADSATGTWVGDIQNYSVNTNFPKALDPIKKLNGAWKITDSGLDYVKAELNTNTGKNILHLKKKA